MACGATGGSVSKLSPAAQEIMDAVTRNAIETALANHGGNISAAARRCNMPLSTFHGWMRRLNITAQRRLPDGT
jgi:transcriptional regulator of acetoin/glycerol metabolism